MVVVLEGEDAREFEEHMKNPITKEELWAFYQEAENLMRNRCVLCGKECVKYACAEYRGKQICSYCLEALHYLFARDFKCEDMSDQIPEWVAEMERRLGEI